MFSIKDSKGFIVGLAMVFAVFAGFSQASEPLTVNINTADAATIAQVLDGVGESKAAAIVEYREKHGEFVSASDLTQVKGIGGSTVGKNTERIVLK